MRFGKSSRNRLTKVRPVFQLQETECGPAVLAMILHYFGKFVPLEEVRETVGVSRNGASVANILRSARTYKLKADAIRSSVEALQKNNSPIILYWEFRHYLILEGFKTRRGEVRAFLSDPATGRYQISLDEFGRSFTGLAIRVSPGENFRVGGRRRSAFSGLRDRLKGRKFALSLVIVSSLLLSAIGIVSSLLTKTFVDQSLLGGDESLSFNITIFSAVVAILTGLITYRRTLQLQYVQLLDSTVSSSSFLKHVLLLPARFYRNRAATDLTQRMSSNDAISDIIALDLSNVIVNVIMIAFYAAFMWTHNAALTVVCLVGATANVAVLATAARMRGEDARRLRINHAKWTTQLHRGFSSIEEVKATSGGQRLFDHLTASHAELTSVEQRAGVPLAISHTVSSAISSTSITVILVLGGIQVAAGEQTVGLLTSFLALAQLFSAPVQHLTQLGGKIQDVSIALERMADISRISVKANAPRRHGDGSIFDVPIAVSVNGVSYCFSSSDPLSIKEVSFHVHSNRVTALVGPSGSGKSTLLRLIAGVFTETSGSILINSIKRRDMCAYDFAANASFVDQETSFFSGSVYENVTLWDSSIPEERVIASLKLVEVYDAIKVRDGGIHSLVERQGRNFSGGQRQRLELARAIVRQPRLLILDEAMSALDSISEIRIMRNLRSLDCTILLASHRLSVLRAEDQVVVLERGSVAEIGFHSQLTSAKGRYAALLEGEMLQ